jgi:signal peptidase I
MIDGVLHINGRPVKKEFAGLHKTTCDGRLAEIPTYRETLPDSISYVVEECYGDRGPLDNVGPYLVPADHFFLMGDNRDQSQDSRVTSAVGYVHIDDVVGKAQILFFSVDGENTRFWEIWKWPFAIRYGRILDPVR